MRGRGGMLANMVGKLSGVVLVCAAMVMPSCRDHRTSSPASAPVPSSDASASQQDIESADTIAPRERLVKSIAQSARLSPRVEQAMLAVPRHAFVPESLRDRAYADEPLGIGEGQTISQPTVVAMMTQALELQGHEVVLEVGTGSGYQAAVLAKLCKRVETIELIEKLARRAQAALQRAGASNVRVHVGDGYEGLPQLAPFDAIIITAAPPEIPEKLIGQLREGGRMVLPVGQRDGTQELIVLHKTEGALQRTSLGPVRFVPMVKP